MSLDDPLAPAAPPPAATISASDATGKAKPPYRKLPGRMPTLRVGTYGIRKLYLGDDHLLQVDTVFFVEHYKRFAYADIRSLLVRKTVRGSAISIVLGLLAVIFGLLGLGTSDEAARWTLWGCAGVCAVLFVINLARGPTCRCRLETAIGLQPLLSLSRLRPARRALALLTERIVAVQGELSPGEAAQRLEERQKG